MKLKRNIFLNYRLKKEEVAELVDKIIEQEGFEKDERKDTLSRTQFNRLLNLLKETDSFAKQKNLLLMTSLQKNFTVNQVYRVLHCINEIDNKFTILELLVRELLGNELPSFIVA